MSLTFLYLSLCQQTNKHMEFVTRGQAKKETGLTYIGNVNHSSKIVKNKKKNVLTYIIYLAPANLSGFNVCPKSTPECRNSCLHSSGHNRIDMKENMINKCRIKKTQLFFNDRKFFMSWVYAEILAYQSMASKKGMEFSVRLNGTSDISPLLFTHKGKTLFDYTKVLNYSRLMNRFRNYDLTFSYSGYNWNECLEALNMGIRISVVFENEIPKMYMGIPVIDADETDLRYMDNSNVICGLKFKKVRKKINIKKQKFIVAANDIHCKW